MADEHEPTTQSGPVVAEPGTTDPNVTEPAAAEEGADKSEEKPEKLNQQVEIIDVGPCKKHIKVTVARPDIDKRLEEKYAELVGDSHVPGFRPGKAPRQIVIRKFKK